jgi:hypothetical protein
VLEKRIAMSSDVLSGRIVRTQPKKLVDAVSGH